MSSMSNTEDRNDHEPVEDAEKSNATVIEDPIAPSSDGSFVTRRYATKHRLDVR